MVKKEDNIPLKYIPKYLSDTDIGIVPQLKSISKKKVKKNLGNLISKQLFKKVK